MLDSLRDAPFRKVAKGVSGKVLYHAEKRGYPTHVPAFDIWTWRDGQEDSAEYRLCYGYDEAEQYIKSKGA